MNTFRQILGIYNPWWEDGSLAFAQLPEFHRTIFDDIYRDLIQLPQMISVTGPRRVGKSTLLKQIIKKLIESGTTPDSIIYYSFDDPALLSDRINRDDFVNSLFTGEEPTNKKPKYLFLDEIQSLPNWELYLKKYYDLGFPIKVFVSGSATSPIFKKSRESLLGRLKDYHLLSFSFYEFVAYSLTKNKSLITELTRLHASGKNLLNISDMSSLSEKIPQVSDGLKAELDRLLSKYFLEGGYSEVWTLPSMEAKQDYLFDNQVKKVIYEDLVLAADFRKPEMLKRFYISLLENPGKEISLNTFANETEINLQQIQKYLPLLEMTDLVYSLPKFRAQALRIRKGLAKYYISDLALRNAVMRLTDSLLDNHELLGLYAENLVFLTLRRSKNVLQIDYYREKNNEVDFIVHTVSAKYLPIEVKYRNSIERKYLSGLEYFREKHEKIDFGLVITKNWSDSGEMFGNFAIPLPLYLVMMG